MLRAKMRSGLPAGIEQHQQRPDVVLGRDAQKYIEPVLKALGIARPELILQEDPHGVHPDRFAHAELFVDKRGIERGCLEHLKLIDGVGGNEVRADQPGLPGIPCLRLGFAPARGLMLRRLTCCD